MLRITEFRVPTSVGLLLVEKNLTKVGILGSSETKRGFPLVRLRHKPLMM